MNADQTIYLVDLDWFNYRTDYTDAFLTFEAAQAWAEERLRADCDYLIKEEGTDESAEIKVWRGNNGNGGVDATLSRYVTKTNEWTRTLGTIHIQPVTLHK
jgi:hypothetical protein